MNDIMMYGSALIAVIIVVIMLIKKMDIKITLFAMGIVLMYIAIAMGNPIAIKEFESTGLTAVSYTHLDVYKRQSEPRLEVLPVV